MSRRRAISALTALFILGGLAVAARSSVAAGTTVDITRSATAATYVSADSKDTNFNNVALLYASHVSYRTLLQFATGIPAGSTINSATITIDPATTDSGAFQVYNVGSFDPTTVTWNNGPSVGATVLGESTSPEGGVSQTIPLMGLDVGEVMSVAVMYSQEGTVAKLGGLSHNAPVLNVDYTPPGGTTTVPTDTTTTTEPSSTSTTTVPSSTTTVPSTLPSTTTTVPSTTTTQPPAISGHKVVVVMEENHSQSEALASMPYLASLANQYGQATNYFAVSHPSLPNYFAVFGGSTFGTSSDCSVGSTGCVPATSSVWDQTIAAGETAKAYEESMTSNCQTNSSGAYAPKHGPWPYWTDAIDRANCNANDVPLGTTTTGNLLADISSGNLPVTGEITPNLNNDAHDGSLAQADSWLQGWLPVLMAGPDYTSGNLTIIVTFDEDDYSQGNKVDFVVIDPILSHKVVTGMYNHYSLTRWLDDNAGVPPLGNAGSAPDLRASFGL